MSEFVTACATVIVLKTRTSQPKLVIETELSVQPSLQAENPKSPKPTKGPLGFAKPRCNRYKSPRAARRREESFLECYQMP